MVTEHTYTVFICDGSEYLYFVISAGRVLSWGRNDYGQLGQGDTWDCAQPRLLPLVGVEAVYAGKRHSGAIAAKISVSFWKSQCDCILPDGTGLFTGP